MGEKIKYLEISYPNFVLGSIIDPEEANQNNYDLVTKINDIIEGSNNHLDSIVDLYDVKADKTLLTSTVNELAGVGRTTQTVKGNFDAMTAHKLSNDHDIKYYKKSEIDSRVATLTLGNTDLKNSLSNHKVSGDHDNRYYTKDQLVPWLRGGDTLIREEVFTIINSNLGDGTFTYTDKYGNHVGQITEDGGQVFELLDGHYEIGENRIEIIINDTLRRSQSSGGIYELSNTSFELSPAEGDGTEITAKYYEKIGFTAEYNIKMSADKPPENQGKTMWFRVI